MLRTTIPAVVALVCLGVVGEAQAQTAGSGFGSLGTSGQFIISGERLVGLSFWSVKRQSSSHRILQREGWPDFVFAFHDQEEIGPRMLARIGRQTGLKPNDL